MRFRAHEAALATGGRLAGADVEFDGVSFDSRSIQARQLFVPIVAERDGHDFIASAVERGAAGFLTDRDPPMGVGGTAIVVGDTLQALMALARQQRRLLPATVIGVTGSVGKTSTKDLARSALGASQRTWANERSFNNDQGLPTTILNAPADTEVLVLEMGMRGFGEIERLCSIALPEVGVVTRVAEAHGDRVGGRAGVQRAKAELVRALPASGTAILNGDDPLVRAMSTMTDAAVVVYGEHDGSDVHISELRLDHAARPRFVVRSPWGTVHVSLGVSGRHMASNAAAALACVGVVGGDLTAAAAALGSVRLTSGRMELLTLASGGIVLDDSYNANPTSMRAAIDALVELPAERRWAVVGVMAEITDPAAEHEAIAAYAEQRGVIVVPVGTDMYGRRPIDVADVATAVRSVAGGDAVLVKGSRVAGLERAVATLVDLGGGLVVQAG